ncbi:flagellar hook-associated protein FlgK [Thaumasiovibrio subtropicus]|uniref:flagellar hook-associated protein FlgK n=1 Tax=Thaumasiovibrio subtropicus TaxID=1891207 RepID=UPI000B35A22F|nr:flagellar hook-associated protein FlgK [Thaumasiovibrio subtropicus]
MGFDLLNLGAQGVLTAQRQLNTTGHNISNVNTEGYSRQTVIQQTNDPLWWGGNQHGMGSHIAAVSRSFDQFAANEVNLATTNLSYAEEREAQLGQLDTTLANSAKKIPEDINDWYDAVKSLADTPNDMGARKVVLEKARMVASGLNHNYAQLVSQRADTNDGLAATLSRINDIGAEIVDIHKALVKSPSTDNDLLDRHNQLINELSQYTKVTVTRKGKESYNVMIGTGHTLVSGTESSELLMVEGSPDPQQTRLALREGKATKVIQTADLDGKLAAALEQRDKTIPQAMDELGRLAIGFTETMNRLQNQGLDLNGEVGVNMFNDINDPDAAANRVVIPAGSNAQMSVFIDDLSQLKMGEYALRYDGTTYTVTLPDGNRQQVVATGTPPSFELDGLRVEVGVPPATDEKILLRPSRSAAGLIQVTMDDASQIAAQSFLSSESRMQGNAEVNVAAIGSRSEFKVMVSPDASQFAVLDRDGTILQPPQAYPPTTPIVVDGTVIELGDGAKGGDVFAFHFNPAEGDNGNLIRMQNTQRDKVMNDGKSTFIDIYQGLTTDIGVQKASASRLRDVAEVEKTAAESKVAEISGVNLDEEAANLMKFQQAYMASSRIMTAANKTFETLLDSTR